MLILACYKLGSQSLCQLLAQDEVSQTTNYDTQYDVTDATADTATYGADTTVADDAQAQSAYTDTELVPQSVRDLTANTTSATLQSDMKAMYNPWKVHQ